MSIQSVSESLSYNGTSVSVTKNEHGLSTFWYRAVDRKRFISDIRRFADTLEALMSIEERLTDPQEAELRQAKIVWLEREAEGEQARRYG
jgi:hypothetical protein